MAYKSYRIKVQTGQDEKVVNVQLKQGIDTLKILSLELNTKDTYQLHTSNYGVIIGRVLGNNSYGVPNTKVSVFIPLDSIDKEDSEIESIYPYTTMQVTNDDGKRYNLLPDSSFAGYDGNYSPIGSFPNKRKVLDNDIEVSIFDKYLKYTTVTNEYGDYIIFGVPTGATQVHINCDLSDIGLLSQRPYDMVAKGYNASLFKSMTEFKVDNIDSAPQILTQDKTITVFPFWGDNNENRIGITRCDINLNYEFTPCCVFMGSCVTDPSGSYIGVNGIPNGNCGRFSSLNTSTGNIEVIRKNEDGTIEALSDNVNGIIDGNGVWCYQIPMNLDKIGMDEEGNIIPINTPGQGIPTRARVRMRLSLTSTDDSSTSQYTGKVLIPCNPPLLGNNTFPRLNFSDNFTQEDWDNYFEFGYKTPDCCFRDLHWNKVYSVKGFYPRIQNGPTDPIQTDISNSENVDYSQMPINYAMPLSCISFITTDNGTNTFPYNTLYSGAENMNDTITFSWFMKHLVDNSTSTFSEKGLHFCLENDWVNGCLYLPHVMIKIDKSGRVDYFGRKNDEDEDELYNHIYLTGRHELQYSGGRYKMHNDWVDRWAQTKSKNTTIDKTSRFSQIKLPIGIIKKVENSLGASIYYYRCGGTVGTKYYRLYSNDIILLGNLVDVFDTLPQLYKKLPSTTAIFPPLAPPKELDESGMNMNGYKDQLSDMYHDWGSINADSERVDIYRNRYATKSAGTNLENLDKYQEYGEYSNALWEDAKASCLSSENGEIMFYAQERLALYFAYRVGYVDDYLHYYPSTFVNTSRICELDVQNDHAIKGTLLYNEFTFPINGIIDRFDISNSDARSEFASMNYDINKYYIDEKTKRKNYIPTPLYLVDFDGRLNNYTKKRNFNFIDEEADSSYILFRYGDSGLGPLKYSKSMVNDSWNLNSDLIIPENSFYFYFGLNSGFSAIDKLYSNYCADSTALVTLDNALNVNIVANKCSDENESTSDVNIIAAYNLVAPLAYYLYQNNNLISKNVNYSNTIFISGLTDASYIIEVEDCQNHTAKREFDITTEQITVSCYNSNDKDFTVSLNNIDSNEISNAKTYESKVVGDNFIITTENNKSYVVSFNMTVTAKSETNEVEVLGNTYTDYIINFTFPQNTSEALMTVNDQYAPCRSRDITLHPTKLKGVVTYLNGVPTDLIKTWNTGSHVYDSYNPLDININYYNELFKDYTKQEQLSFVCNLLGALWGGDNMELTHEGGNNKINDICVSAIDGNSNNLISETFSDLYLYNYTYLNQFVSIDGYCNTNSDLPHLIGKNYPCQMCNGERNPMKLSYGDVHADFFENVYFIDNKKLEASQLTNYNSIWQYIIASKDKTLANFNYFGIDFKDGTTSPSNWSSEKLKNLNKSALCLIPSSELQGMYKFQTLDKRLDYTFCIDTPIILPSGYDKFPNLTSYALREGSLKAFVYGGVALKFSGDTITSPMPQEEFKWDESKGYYVNNSTLGDDKRRYYQALSYEDNDISNEDKVIGYMEDMYSIRSSKNDFSTQAQSITEFNVKNGLKGKDSINIKVTDCSCDFSDGYVHEGNTININVSYKAGMRPYHASSIGDGTYNLVYTESETSGKYIARTEIDGQKFPKISGHTQTRDTVFKVYPDSSYVGDTCLYVHLENSGLDNNMPSWSTLYNDVYVDAKDKGKITSNELTIRQLNDDLSDIVNWWRIEKWEADEDSGMDHLAVNWDWSDVPYYLSNGHNAVCYDSDANQYLKFYRNHEVTSEPLSDYSTVIVSCDKIYQETDKKTLLREGFVSNRGYAYYASKITVTQTTKDIKVQLYSPLIGSDGTIKYDEVTSLKVGGHVHTVGVINSFNCPLHNVTYDEDRLCFTITKNENDAKGDVLPFYFEILNGLRYAVNINIK